MYLALLRYSTLRQVSSFSGRVELSLAPIQSFEGFSSHVFCKNAIAGTYGCSLQARRLPNPASRLDAIDSTDHSIRHGNSKHTLRDTHVHNTRCGQLIFHHTSAQPFSFRPYLIYLE